ncbi:hypothetical protein SKAU_G00126390 [Synaphobranchus kaupii]|uniref:Uncharacterized protein n=1 Tax=Synaphobranchus kaupii TaxID=118154 RepID=A0A9Q1FPQ1_SYNKA|nr:hypothetical protein SKAU_G00126390 [Synaphobranchus kaupii]
MVYSCCTFSIFDGAADIEMAYKQKKHRAMGDEEWMSRLRTFAALGVWPSEAGNRPATRQKKWYDLKIEKCPMQLRGKNISVWRNTDIDTTTRTLILFCITRSNIWSDSNTTLTTTVSAAAATAASGAHAISPAAPQQQLASLFVTCCIIKSVTTSSASALPLPTTLPATATTVRPSGPPSMTPAAPEQQLAVDEHSVPGMDRVDSLAEYLVGLRTETGQTLNNQQASTIIALWQNLLPYDQQRVACAARHQVRLTTGRFRCSKKKPDFTPARPPTSVPLASKYCRTGSGQEEVCSSGPTSPSSTVCPPEAASSEAVVPSAGTSTYICPFACCP